MIHAWKQRKLGEIIEVCSGRDYKHLEKGNVPVYGTGGYMLSVSKALSADKDAVGIGRKGTIDKPYILKAPFWTVDTLFYCVSKELFNQLLNKHSELVEYVNTYYRKKLSETISRQELMTMNGKNGAVCAFIYYLVTMFGKEARDGILIDLKITNDDIAGFCGISTRHSVNRILRGLREEHVIRTLYNKIMVLDVEYLKQFVDVKVDA